MNSSSHRYIVSLTTAMLILSGCGVSQIQNYGLSGLPQSAAHRNNDLTSASGDLVYATGGCGGVCVLSYPSMQLVDSITINGGVGGDCSDALGDVFVTNDSEVLEYAHGGTNPIATLALPGYGATGCSVDSATGNLAVVFRGTGVDVAVFTDAGGTPTTYSAHTGALYCGYDNASNLFVSGASGSTPQLSELAKGSGDFSLLSVIGQLGNPGQVQWDGAHLTYEGLTSGGIKVSRLRISGSRARIVSKTRFKSGIRNATQSWIYDGAVLIPYSTRGQSINKIGLWDYPEGGKVVTAFKQSKYWKFMGVTVSTASQHAGN